MIVAVRDIKIARSVHRYATRAIQQRFCRCPSISARAVASAGSDRNFSAE
jgi:hypothetical protein